MTFHVLDLFSGIGGFSLGLERTGGFKTVAFCEIEKYPQQILKQHWPEVPIYDDVKTLTAEKLRADGITVDVICGGFPCQDISLAGRGEGLAGERSGLWFEFHRLIKETRPSWVIIENVSALRSRGLDAVLGSLNEIGYDAEWHCIPAAAVGAPHRRDRIWIVAYPTIMQQHGRNIDSQISSAPKSKFGDSNCQNNVADPCITRLQGYERSGQAGTQGQSEGHVAKRGWWSVEPNVGRVAYGVPKRVDRLKALGNAVVPQIPQLIGEAILASSH